MAAGESHQQSPNASQIDESDSLPFSFPSQPPDIKFWFSSYQYESPGSSDSSHGLEDENIDLFLKDEKVVESRNPLVSEEQRSQNEYSLESDSFTIEGNKNSPLKEEPKMDSSSREKLMVPNVWRQQDPKNENFLNIKREKHNGMDRITNQKEILQCEEAFPKHESCRLQNSQRLGGNKKTEQKEDSPVLEENGFISTKNRDITMKNGESSKNQGLAVNGKKRNRIEKQEDTSILGKEQHLLERRALADQTNALLAEEAIAEEESGKWKCPRKSKPYAGPPLKQLRMGRWVRRVVKHEV